MKRIKRIKNIELGSYKIEVVYKKTVIDPDSGQAVSGLCDIQGSRLFIATHSNGEVVGADYLLHSVTHELAHFIMELMGETKLYKNEKFIDGLGLHIAQFYKSAR